MGTGPRPAALDQATRQQNLTSWSSRGRLHNSSVFCEVQGAHTRGVFSGLSFPPGRKMSLGHCCSLPTSDPTPGGSRPPRKASCICRGPVHPLRHWSRVAFQEEARCSRPGRAAASALLAGSGSWTCSGLGPSQQAHLHRPQQPASWDPHSSVPMPPPPSPQPTKGHTPNCTVAGSEVGWRVRSGRQNAYGPAEFDSNASSPLEFSRFMGMLKITLTF